MSIIKSHKFVESIFDRIKSVYGLNADYELANFLGVKQNTISSWKSRESIDYDLIIEKCKGVSLDWLILGKGEPVEGTEIVRELAIKEFEKEGISNRNFCAVAGLIKTTYSNIDPRQKITSKWAYNLTKVFQILISLEIKNLKSLLPYLHVYKQVELEPKINEMLDKLKNKKIAYVGEIDWVVSGFGVIVSEGKFEISNKNMVMIKSLLEPWCFWLIRAGIYKHKKEIGIMPFENVPDNISYTGERERTFIIHKDDVRIDFLFAIPDKRIFACLVQFSQQHTSFDCSSHTFFYLLSAAYLFDKNNPISKYEDWEIVKGHYPGYDYPCYIRRHGVTVNISEKQFDDFIEVLKEASADIRVREDLMREHVEEFGAV